MKTLIRVGVFLIVGGFSLLGFIMLKKNSHTQINQFFPNSSHVSIFSTPTAIMGELHFIGRYKELSGSEAINWYVNHGFSIDREKDAYYGHNQKGVRFKMSSCEFLNQIEIWQFLDD
jgi:hypothetical protein